MTELKKVSDPLAPASTMKQRKGSSSERSEILDDKEQEELVSLLRRDVDRQIKNARTYMHWVLLLLCVMMMTCLVYSSVHPLEMEHQVHFEDKIPHWAFQLYYVLSAACFFFAALTTKRGHENTPTQIKVAATVIAVATSAFWFFVFALHGITIPQLYWLPLANPGAVLLALYIDRDAEYLKKDLERLETLKYNHKSI